MRARSVRLGWSNRLRTALAHPNDASARADGPSREGGFAAAGARVRTAVGFTPMARHMDVATRSRALSDWPKPMRSGNQQTQTRLRPTGAKSSPSGSTQCGGEKRHVPKRRLRPTPTGRARKRETDDAQNSTRVTHARARSLTRGGAHEGGRAFLFARCRRRRRRTPSAMAGAKDRAQASRYAPTPAAAGSAAPPAVLGAGASARADTCDGGDRPHGLGGLRGTIEYYRWGAGLGGLQGTIEYYRWGAARVRTFNAGGLEAGE